MIAAIETLEDGFVVYDPQDRLKICNRRYREFYAKTAAVLVPGTPFGDIVRYAIAQGQFPLREGSADDWIARRTNRDQTNLASFERTLPDGRILRVVERLTPDGDRIEVHSDITKLKQAEQRVLNVIEGAQVCTWEWDIVADDQYVNERWAEIIGYTLEELTPITYNKWRDLVHPEDLPATEALTQLCFHGQTDNYEAEYRQRHKDGHWIWLLDRGRMLRRSPNGAPEFMVGVQVAITEQKARARPP